MSANFGAQYRSLKEKIRPNIVCKKVFELKKIRKDTVKKILENSDDRMRRIFGGQNYHEGHLQVAEMPSTSNAVENENIANLDIAQFVRNIPRETTPADPTEGSSNQIHEVKRGTFWIFWFIIF